MRGKERKWRGPGWFAWRSHDDFHRVEIPEGGYAMTLFIKGPHGKMGSFFMDKGKPVKIPDEIYAKFKPYFCDTIKT